MVKPLDKSETKEVTIIEVEDMKNKEQIVELQCGTNQDKTKTYADIKGKKTGTIEEEFVKSSSLLKSKEIDTFQVIECEESSVDGNIEDNELSNNSKTDTCNDQGQLTFNNDPDPYMLNPRFMKKLPDSQEEKKQKLFSCEECTYQTQLKAMLVVHKDVIHLGKRHKCNQCDYESKYPNSLKLHIEAKHEGVVFSCQLCDLKYSRKGHLSRHMTTNHEKSVEKKHKCHECDYTTTFKSHLKRHVGRKHEGQPTLKRVQSRKFQCPQCDHKALSNSHLKRHVGRKHEGQPTLKRVQSRKFQCPQCDHKSLNDSHLKRHIHTKHDLRYLCKKCDVKFSLRVDYKKHMLSDHANIKCKYCPEKFLSKQTFKKHMKSKHVEQTFPCDQCDYVGLKKQFIDMHKLFKHTAQTLNKTTDMSFMQALETPAPENANTK